MNQTLHKLMLSRFADLYGALSAPNPAAALEEYDKALRGFIPEALQHGADKVIAENTFRSWPTIGECVKACSSYRAPYGQARALDEDKVFLPPHGSETGRTPEEREAHIAETRRMIGELKAKVIETNVLSEPKRYGRRS